MNAVRHLFACYMLSKFDEDVLYSTTSLYLLHMYGAVDLSGVMIWDSCNSLRFLEIPHDKESLFIFGQKYN